MHIFFVRKLLNQKSKQPIYCIIQKVYTYIAFVCNSPHKMHNVLNKKIRTIKKVDFYTFFYIETSKITQHIFWIYRALWNVDLTSKENCHMWSPKIAWVPPWIFFSQRRLKSAATSATASIGCGCRVSQRAKIRNTLKPWYSEQVRQTPFVHYIK